MSWDSTGILPMSSLYSSGRALFNLWKHCYNALVALDEVFLSLKYVIRVYQAKTFLTASLRYKLKVWGLKEMGIQEAGHYWVALWEMCFWSLAHIRDYKSAAAIFKWVFFECHNIMEVQYLLEYAENDSQSDLALEKKKKPNLCFCIVKYWIYPPSPPFRPLKTIQMKQGKKGTSLLGYSQIRQMQPLTRSHKYTLLPFSKGHKPWEPLY